MEGRLEERINVMKSMRKGNKSIMIFSPSNQSSQ